MRNDGLTTHLTAVLALCVVLSFQPTAAQAQPGFRYPERALLWQLYRVDNGRDWQRYYYANQSLRQADRLRYSEWQRQQAARLRGAQRGGLVAPRPPIRREPPAANVADDRQSVDPDLLLVWRSFGVGLATADPDLVKTADEKLDRGMTVVAVKTGGPASKAGWRKGDIIAGLDRYRVGSLANVAFVAESATRPGAVLQALLVRDGKVIVSNIEIPAVDAMAK